MGAVTPSDASSFDCYKDLRGPIGDPHAGKSKPFHKSREHMQYLTSEQVGELLLESSTFCSCSLVIITGLKMPWSCMLHVTPLYHIPAQ